MYYRNDEKSPLTLLKQMISKDDKHVKTNVVEKGNFDDLQDMVFEMANLCAKEKREMMNKGNDPREIYYQANLATGFELNGDFADNSLITFTYMIVDENNQPLPNINQMYTK